MLLALFLWFPQILAQDRIYFNVMDFETTQKPDKILDIYTNLPRVSEVWNSFNERRTNSRYLEETLPLELEDLKSTDRNSFDYKGAKKDHIESEFGEILDPKQEWRRPRFKTQKYNWTRPVSTFSYVQKIPKFSETKSQERVNDMLKKYLTKLYAKKYQGGTTSVEDHNLHSKFFDQNLWSLKNKTKSLVKKLFSLFTVVQFANSQCSSASSAGQYQGTCYTPEECTNLAGTPMGNCANNYGVCCVFRGTCGGSSNQNCTYFESPNYPNYYPSDNGVIVPTTDNPMTTDNPSPTPDPRLRQKARQTDNIYSCVFSISKLNNNIQQMRIDFVDLELRGPTDGRCVEERLVISGQNINSPVPVICGYNTGQHVYVDVSMMNGPLQLSVLSTVLANKRWKIRVCQLATSCNNPSNCLQYYTGVMGVLSSFNYDQAAMFNRSVPGYFNNLNYAICIRKEAGYCSITYSNEMNGVEYPFQFRNVDDNRMSTVPPGQAGADIFNCPDDYLVIGATRLCGDKFNDGQINDDVTDNSIVTDSSAGPIIIPVRTNNAVTGQGFRLYYTQNRCTV